MPRSDTLKGHDAEEGSISCGGAAIEPIDVAEARLGEWSLLDTRRDD